MSVTEGLLIALVFILIFSLVTAPRRGNSDSKSYTCVDNNNGRQFNVDVTGGADGFEGATMRRVIAEGKNPEAMKRAEMMEGFAVLTTQDDVTKDMSCACKDMPTADYQGTEYGMPNADYKEYVTSQAVDDAVIANHKDFVWQRHGQYATGRTYTADTVLDGVDQIKWWGLRRPDVRVPIANPTQVPEIDIDYYLPNRKFFLFT